MFDALANKLCFVFDTNAQRYHFVGYNSELATHSFRDAVSHSWNDENVELWFPSQDQHLYKVHRRLISELKYTD